MVAAAMTDEGGAGHLRDPVSGLRGYNGDARQTCCQVVREIGVCALGTMLLGVPLPNDGILLPHA